MLSNKLVMHRNLGLRRYKINNSNAQSSERNIQKTDHKILFLLLYYYSLIHTGLLNSNSAVDTTRYLSQYISMGFILFS